MPRTGRTRGLAEVVPLDPVARAVHGERALEGDLPRLSPAARGADEGEPAVHREQQFAVRRPARGHGCDVAVDRDGAAVDDEGAGAVGWRRGAQIGEAASVRGEGRGHDLRGLGLGVLDGDRARAVGRVRRRRYGPRRRARRRGDACRGRTARARRPGDQVGSKSSHAPSWRGPSCPCEAGEPGELAASHVQDVQIRYGLPATGSPPRSEAEGDPGAVGRPGRAAVVPGAVGALPQSGAVGAQVQMWKPPPR